MSMISISGFSMKEELVSKEDDEEIEIKNSEFENDNSSFTDSFNEKTDLKNKSKINEESEISDIKNSMINEYDYDISNNDSDFDVDTEFLKDITRELGKSEINFSNIKSEESDEDEDEDIKRKVSSRNNISNCYYNLKEREPEFEIDLNKGLTQMVDEKINKVKDLPYYINNQMIEVLMLAEKPSLAKIIAYVLKREGKNFKIYTEKGLTIYTYEGRFKGKKAFFTVSSIRGHVYQDNFKEKIKRNFYQDDDINVNELYEEKIVKALKRNNDEDITKFINVPQFLRNIAEGKDILCLWLDCDPEGENICYEVIHNVLPYMNKRDYQQIYRAQFNSLTKKDIRQSFENLSDYPDKELSMSVDARSIIDFKVGVCFTRLFSDKILNFLKENNQVNQNKRVLSYGPCQTPTLWFVVQRAKEKRSHKKSSYYRIFIEIEDDDGNPFKLYYKKKFNKTNLKKKLHQMRFNFFAELTNIKHKDKRQLPPPGIKTTTMLKMASLQLKISPYDASKIAQQLYIKGLISYPRTGSTKYSENFEFQESLEMFKDNPHFSDKVNDLLINFDKSQFDFSRGEVKGGHQPIVPTKSIEEQYLENKNQWNLYRCNYFASLSPQLEYENMKCEFHLGKYKFKKTFSKLKKKGFLNFLTLKRKKFVEKFPSFTLNKSYKIVNIDYVHLREPSPEYLTEAELIDEMEKKKIGTDGSIPSHILNLTKRGYVKVDEHRRIKPTRLGISLIDSLNEIIPDIVKPENRANIEQFVKQIASGDKSYQIAIESALEFYREKLKYCNNNIDKVKDGFGKHFHLKKS